MFIGQRRVMTRMMFASSSRRKAQSHYESIGGVKTACVAVSITVTETSERPAEPTSEVDGGRRSEQQRSDVADVTRAYMSFTRATSSPDRLALALLSTWLPCRRRHPPTRDKTSLRFSIQLTPCHVNDRIWSLVHCIVVAARNRKRSTSVAFIFGTVYRQQLINQRSRRESVISITFCTNDVVTGETMISQLTNKS